MSDSSRVESLFHAALAEPTPADRAAFLDAACGGDPDLRHQVDRLLAAAVAAAAGEFLEQPAVPVAEVGTRVGPYKLLQKLGEGGMGEVWVAEQAEPVKRRVALKLIKAGMDTARVVARFEAERQALALMDHTNIAKVFDAGTTPAGRPYFVMELVKGVPITTYCDELHLPIRERLDLFVQVCAAVQHAHQKGVIHRDLKPANVLIAVEDGRPLPKVIDFGVAKALHTKLADHTMYTEIGAVIGTLEYMAPEQAELSALDIDTRADVYALGVLLYELLTGTTPLTRDRLKTAAYTEVLRLIREVEPPKPSTRLSESKERIANLAANRRTEPKRLMSEVRGELDWIVMKALEKDRTRRYETANGLSRDVQRFLADEPVEAGRPSGWYRLRKLVRRHRGPVLATVIVLAALVAGMIGTTWQAIRASSERDAKEQARLEAVANEEKARAAAAAEKAAQEAEAAQRRRAEAVADLLLSVLAGLDPTATARDLKEQLAARLDEVAADLDKKYTGDPLLRARLRNALAATQRGLGEPRKAVALNELALAEHLRELGPDHRETLVSQNRLAMRLQEAGLLDRALPLFERTLQRLIATLGPEHPDTLYTVSNLAGAYQAAGQQAKAIPLFERTLEKLKAERGPDHADTLVLMNNLANAYRDGGQRARAIPLFEEALERARDRLGPDNIYTLSIMNNLAQAYRQDGQLHKALPLLKETADRRLARFGPDHPFTWTSLNNLALAYQDDGRVAEAIPFFERVLEKRKAKLGLDHPDTWTSLNNLALAYNRAGRPGEALPLFELALEQRERRLGPHHPSTLTSLNNLAQVREDTGQLDRAESLWRELARRHRAIDGPESIPTARMVGILGNCLLKQGKYAPAEVALRESLAIFVKADPDDVRTFLCRSMLGDALLGQHKYAEAEPLLVQGYEGTKQRAGKLPARLRTARLTETLDRLVRLYDAWGKPAEAAKWRAEAAKYRELAPPPRPAK